MFCIPLIDHPERDRLRHRSQQIHVSNNESVCQCVCLCVCVCVREDLRGTFLDMFSLSLGNPVENMSVGGTLPRRSFFFLSASPIG